MNFLWETLFGSNSSKPKPPRAVSPPISLPLEPIWSSLNLSEMEIRVLRDMVLLLKAWNRDTVYTVDFPGAIGKEVQIQQEIDPLPKYVAGTGKPFQVIIPASAKYRSNIHKMVPSFVLETMVTHYGPKLLQKGKHSWDHYPFYDIMGLTLDVLKESWENQTIIAEVERLITDKMLYSQDVILNEELPLPSGIDKEVGKFLIKHLAPSYFLTWILSKYQNEKNISCLHEALVKADADWSALADLQMLVTDGVVIQEGILPLLFEVHVLRPKTNEEDTDQISLQRFAGFAASFMLYSQDNLIVHHSRLHISPDEAKCLETQALNTHNRVDMRSHVWQSQTTAALLEKVS